MEPQKETQEASQKIGELLLLPSFDVMKWDDISSVVIMRPLPEILKDGQNM